MRPQSTLATQQDETNMYAPHPPAHHNHVLQPTPSGSAPSVSADWNPWQARLLSGSSVLPEQFFNPQASLFTGRPVAALLRAVLEDALACFQRQFLTVGRRVQREAQEAKAWFLSEEEDWPFSFMSVCAVLGLEPDAIRQQLKRWSHSHLATPQRKIQHSTVHQPHRGIGGLP